MSTITLNGDSLTTNLSKKRRKEGSVGSRTITHKHHKNHKNHLPWEHDCNHSGFVLAWLESWGFDSDFIWLSFQDKKRKKITKQLATKKAKRNAKTIVDHVGTSASAPPTPLPLGDDENGYTAPIKTPSEKVISTSTLKKWIGTSVRLQRHSGKHQEKRSSEE